MLIAPQGQDILFDEKRCEVGRNFMNKLWNAARFIQMQRATNPPARPHNAHDYRVLHELNSAIARTSVALDEYRFNEAAKVLYDFVWGDFCDWYIEASKVGPNIAVLDEAFQTILRLLHPYAPFITEELWRGMGYGSDTIQFANWPMARAHGGMEIVLETQALYDIVTAGRQLRNDNGIDPRKKVQFVIKPTQHDEFFLQEKSFLTQILVAETITIDRNYSPTGVTPTVVTGAATVFMVGAVDPAAEKQRLTKLLADLDKQLAVTDAKLANENFVSRAAPVAVAREREKQTLLREHREKVLVLLRSL
jgi:valyl-tRNA synthetase